MSEPTNAEHARQVEAEEHAALTRLGDVIAAETAQVRSRLAAAQAEIRQLRALLESYGVDPDTGQPILPAVRSVDFGTDRGGSYQ